MLASARELGVFDDHSGILVLPPDTPVGVDVVEAVDLRDTVLDVKTAPNRGDILSMRGIAREVALLLGKELKPLDLTVPEAGRGRRPGLGGGGGRRGLPAVRRPGDPGAGRGPAQPLWMARRLYLYGQRPLGAVVDVTNYLLLDQGQPLHAFDLDLVPGRRIVVRRAAEGETSAPSTAATGPHPRGHGDHLRRAGPGPGRDHGRRGHRGPRQHHQVLLESAHFPPASCGGPCAASA